MGNFLRGIFPPGFATLYASSRRRNKNRDLPVGRADHMPSGVITGGYNLYAKYIIHTVGPVWKGGESGEAKLLKGAYRNSLALAAGQNINTLAFPSISTGVYGYPLDEAAQVSSHAIARLLSSDSSVQEVRLIFFSRQDAEIFLKNHSFAS